MKFQYSPGLLGYGAKGSNGSDGLQGLAIYFTDRNPLTDFISVETAITNNEVLWSTAVPGTKLPGGRKYLTEDLFIDPRGFVYRITDAVNGEYEQTGMSLNKSTFFTASPWFNQTLNGFERYFNKADPSSSYLIDNFFTDKEIKYSLLPSKIYGISSKNFARIEYSNITDVSYNAFSLYSSGENVIADDHKSFGIVREVSSNTFRIGNLDDNNLLRDVDLIFDDVSLMYKREIGNLFHKNTAPGTVLTNKEKNTNLLFSPCFQTTPASFTASSTSTSINISWVLADFLNAADPTIKGTLHFYKKHDTSSGYNIDASVFKPFAFHNLGSSGAITITHLTIGETYEYYMSIDKEGWERNSLIKQITTGSSPVYMIIVNPSPPTLTAYPDGRFVGPPATFRYAAQLSTDSFTGWRFTDVPMPNWISTLVAGSPDPGIPLTSGPMGINNFDISISSGYTGYLSRTGIITVNSEASPKTITITQNRRPPKAHTIYMSTYVTGISDARGRIVIDPPLDPGQSVTVTGMLWVKGRAQGKASATRHVRTNTTMYKNGAFVANASSYTYSTGPDNYITDNLDITMTGIVNGDILEVRKGPYFDCGYFTSGTNTWMESWGYFRLDAVTDGYDTFTLDTAKKYWNVTRISCNCGTNCNYSSWVGPIATT